MKRSLETILLIAVISFRINALPADSLSVFSMTEKPIPRWMVPTMIGTIGVSFLLDENLSKEPSSDFLKNVSHLTDYGGDKWYVVPSVLAAYSAGRWILKDSKLQATAWQSFQSLTVAAIATEGFKNLTGRARPFTNHDAFTFQPFPGSDDTFKSMPSGHASLAFAVFTPFAENYSRWLYLVPLSVAFGRVYQNKHWLSDVATGSCIGLISGWLFTHNKNIQLLPNGIIVKF
ncbi:phosphatase PAP2 family protein [Geofilum sp. OHC36d9]|uniref:phosphatase PAP2 family protein n=1 Tax=Geofilum sp. OHC36d9 TaxID=3458413 RepID=UPI004033AAC6